MLITKAKNTNHKNQSFGNFAAAATQTLRYLNTSPAIGATCVDFTSMSAPRTAVDVSRNPDAGLETGVREFSGTTNHALIGTYGVASAGLLSGAFNKKFGVKSNKVFANFDSINTFAGMWNDIVRDEITATPSQLRKRFIKDVIDSAVGTASDAGGKLVDVKIDKKAQVAFMNEISTYIDKHPNSYSLPKKLYNQLKSIVVNSTAAESEYLVKGAKYSTKTDLDSLIKTTFSLSKLFSEPKAMDSFKRHINIETNTFINGLKQTKLRSSLLGVGIGMLIGASIQPFNVWFTKMRTGKEGFVGVEGTSQDTSMKFWASKTAAALGFLGFAYYTIMNKAVKLPIKKQIPILLNKLQFNGFVPSIPQFKAIYAFTIASRLYSSRDKNELRESFTKDFLGFTNWLILGDFVQKLVASCSKKNLTTYDETKHGKGLFNKIFNLNVRVKTHDEILFEELKKSKIGGKMLKSVDGKMLSSNELISKFSETLPNLRKRIRGKNIAQLSGYLYSAVVLGILIPKFNIAFTNYLRNKKQDKQNKINEMIYANNSVAFKSFKK